MTGIEPAIADHLKVLFRDMPDEPLNKLNDRESLLYISIIFMAVVMESDRVSIIMVNAGGRNHRPAKISSDIFKDGIRVTFVGFGIDIKTVFVLCVTESFGFLKGRTNFSFHFVKEGGTESIT